MVVSYVADDGRQSRNRCRNATDHEDLPILKLTGLQSNMQLKHCLRRCTGHGGVQHGWLQGQVGGINKTSSAAVYPAGLCRAIIKDIRNFLKPKKDIFVANSSESYYECERCQLGRYVPKFLDHTFMPGWCRYGRWPEGEGPWNPMTVFRNEAIANKKIITGKLSNIPELPLDQEQANSLKYCFFKMVDDAMRQFENHKIKDTDLHHWSDDVIAKAWMRRIFAPVLNLQGACAHLKAWTKPTPAAKLRDEDGYIRIMAQGRIPAWKMMPLEDLREMSHNQWREAIDIEADWLLTFFRHDRKEDPQTSVPATSKQQPLSSSGGASSSRPQRSPVPQQEEAVVAYAPQEEEGRGEQLVPAEQHGSGVLRPSFDFKRIYQKLPQLATLDQSEETHPWPT